jgi:hypothetical protein
MKTHSTKLVERLRKSWQLLVTAANRKHDPLLLESMVSFNFGGGARELLLKASLRNT